MVGDSLGSGAGGGGASGEAGRRRATRATGTAGATRATRESTAGGGNTAALVVVGGGVGLGGLVGGKVDEDSEIGEDAVGEEVLTQHDVVDEGVVLGGGLLGVDAVVLVECQALRVGDVGLVELDGRDQALVEEELADVVGHAVSQVRVVGQYRRVRRAEHVDVRCAASVVAREHGVELHHTVLVRDLDAAPVRRVQASLAVAHARVNARRVAGPNVDQHVRDRLKGVELDELQVEVKGNTGLGVGNIDLWHSKSAALPTNSDQMEIGVRGNQSGAWSCSVEKIGCKNSPGLTLRQPSRVRW